MLSRLPVLLFALILSAPALAAKAPAYTYTRLGNPVDVITTTTPGIVLMGGGTDVDAAFPWLCGRGGNGDFLVIRATGTDAYNPYIRDLCPNANSVATLIIPSTTAANLAAVANLIAKAEAVWIAGGDQSDYINFWKNTSVQATLNARIGQGVPVGGTSAGLSVLTQFVYSAQASQGVTTSQALADPFNRYMSFDRDFVALPVLQGILGDSHFTTRDRMGRNVAFLCRVAAAGWSAAPRGISVDEMSALLIDTAGGYASLVGSGHAYFLQAPGLPQVCASKKPLTYRNIRVNRIAAGDGFDLRSWLPSGGTSYQVSAEAGVLGSTQTGGSPY